MDDQTSTSATGEREPAPPLAARESAYEPPSVLAAQERRSVRFLLLVVRMLFMVMLVAVTILTVASEEEDNLEVWTNPRVIGLFLAAAAVGMIVLLVDTMTPNKRLTSLVGVYLGVCAGLIGALAVGALLDVVAQAWEISEGRFGTYLGLAKVMIAIILCYLAVSVVLTTKDDFRLVIPYVEFAKQVRGVRPMLIDTSILIDGRIDALGQSGFVDAPLVVPQFVVVELQTLADSSDKLKRARGRRGLEMVSKLQGNPYVDVTIDPADVPGQGVDHKLIRMAGDQKLRILTTDYNLNKVAQINSVSALNLNDLTGTLRPQVIPGEDLLVEIVKRGEAPGQGVGYMPDGTMVVVENAADRVGEPVQTVVTNSLQTSAGRMIFGRLAEDEKAEREAQLVEQMSDAATGQPRATDRPDRRSDPSPRRNPRR